MAKIPLIPMIVYTNSESANLAFPATQWFNAEDWEEVREALETMNMPGSDAMEVTVGFQVANVPNAISSTNSLATMRSGDGLTFPVAWADKTATTGSKQLARGVYLAKNATEQGATARFCWAAGMIETKKK